MAAPRVLLPGWDLQQLVIPEQEGQQKVLFTDTEGNPILVQNGKTHLLAGQQDSHKLLVAGHNYQKFVFPTANKFFSPQQEAQVMRLVVAPDGQKLLLPPQAPRQEIDLLFPSSFSSVPSSLASLQTHSPPSSPPLLAGHPLTWNIGVREVGFG